MYNSTGWARHRRPVRGAMSAGTALQYLILKRFRSKRHLELKKHGITRDRPFWCAICPKRFAAMETTTVHERSHTEKLNGCSMCPQQFGHKLKSDDAPHERTHANNLKQPGEQPYGCSMCPQRLVLGSAARATLRRTSGPTRARSRTLHKVLIFWAGATSFARTSCHRMPRTQNGRSTAEAVDRASVRLLARFLRFFPPLGATWPLRPN